jgi:PHD/YefM family antitoxin component YafN of YafNO toxin-antitoxin module
MFDLNKIIEIIKETKREIFLTRENEDPFVIMTLNRYRELIRKDNSVNENPFVNNIRDVREEDYPMHVKKAIMPEME